QGRHVCVPHSGATGRFERQQATREAQRAARPPEPAPGSAGKGQEVARGPEKGRMTMRLRSERGGLPPLVRIAPVLGRRRGPRGGARCHSRSSSAATTFSEPTTATVSLSRWPSSILGVTAKLRKLGGRVLTRQLRGEPSATM